MNCTKKEAKRVKKAVQKLLTIGGNPKTDKSDGSGLGYFTAILHLSPHKISGVTLCPSASAGCIEACLNTAGRGGIIKKGETTNTVQQARLRRSRFFIENRQGFLDQLRKEIKAFIKRCRKLGLSPAIRLNGTSDVMWELTGIIQEFPEVQFYDYTAIEYRMTARLPENYDLTFSNKEDNLDKSLRVLKAGKNVAVVFQHYLPEFWNGFRVIDGTKHDLRALDPKGVVVGLLAKGKAKKDQSGFVVLQEKPNKKKAA